jgi:hypothetical protein
MYYNLHTTTTMAYEIYLTDGTLFATIEDNSLNINSSMILFGQYYTDYGGLLDTNLIHLLENSADVNAPQTPLTGQLWWNKNTNVLQVFNGQVFKNITGSYANSTPPRGSVAGDLWFDTVNSVLNVYTGTSYLAVGPFDNPNTGVTSANIADNNGFVHSVIQMTVDTQIVGIISSDATFVPDTPIPGFDAVSPGFTLANSIANVNQYFNGTAVNALSLDGNIASDFMNAHTNTGTTGNLSVAKNIDALGNIHASYYIGNGAFLTGISGGGNGTNYSNANVASYLPTYTGGIGGTLLGNDQPYINQVGTLTALAVEGDTQLGARLFVQGNTTIAGNLTVDGNVNFPGNINVITGNRGQFFGDSQGFGALYAGIGTGYANLPSTVLQVSANSNEYAQVNFQNINPGNAASSDFVATADNGTNESFYVDMGIASSTFDGLSGNTLGPVINPNDAYLYTVGNTSTPGPVPSFGGNLILGTGTPNTHVKIVVAGGNDPNVVVDITPKNVSVTGNITANYFFGDGGYIANLPAGNYSNANVANYLPTYEGNVTAAYFLGSGEYLTNLPATDYSNANVAAFLPTYSGNLDGTITANSQPYITQVGTLQSLAVSDNIGANNLTLQGSATIFGNLTISGNVDIPGNINQISGNSGQFFGNAMGFGALYAGISSGYSNLPSTVLQVSANSNEYAQVNFQNINPGNAASSDYVATADNGTNDIYYVDVGIASSTFDGLSGNTLGPVINANDAYLYTMGNTGSNIGGNLIVGTGTVGTHLKLVAGGGTDANVIIDITKNGATVHGNLIANYLLGDGSYIANLPVGNYSNANVANYLPTYEGNVTATYFIGSGEYLTNLPFTNYSNANVAAFLPTYSGDLGGTIISNDQPYINQVGTLSALAVEGDTQLGARLYVLGNTVIDGNMVINGNVSIPGNIEQISGNSGQFFGNAMGFGALYAGISTGYANLDSTVLQVSADSNEYAQVNFQNINAGNAASSDYVATADNGTNDYYYVDMGIASSAFDGLSGNTLGPVINPNDAYLYTLGKTGSTIGGNLIVGAGTANAHIKLVAGGGNDNNVIADITAQGVSVNGNVHASYLFGNGSQITGITASYGNANVETYLASGQNTADIVTTGSFRGQGTGLTGTAPALTAGAVQSISPSQIEDSLGYVPASQPSGTSILYANGSGGFADVTIGTNLTFAGGVLNATGGGGGSSFPTGTRMLFQQSVAPTGWTKDVSYNNYALRVTSGSVTSGGSVPFTTAFSAQTPSGSVSLSSVSIGSTAIDINQMPSHSHGASGNDSGHSHSIGNLNHSHSFSAGGTTDQQNADHSHGYSGQTGGDNPGHAHTGVARTDVPGYQIPAGGGPFTVGFGTSDGPTNQHTHDFGGQTGGMSNGHAHNFGVSGQTSGALGGVGTDTGYAQINVNVGATGGSQGHTHSFSGSGTFNGNPLDLSVNYIDTILATKD